MTMIIPFYIEYLSGVLDVPAYAEVPENPPAAFVTIEQTASNHNDYIKGVTLAFQSWASSMMDAIELNEAVKAAVSASIAENNISRAHCESDYNFTDDSTKHYRYQAMFEIIYY